MFDLVTKYKRVIQVFLGLIALTFATWGIESYTRFRGAGDAVASVNGMKISQREFTDELRRQQDQLRQMFGRAIDPAALDTPESRRTLLDSLIAQRLVDQRSEEHTSELQSRGHLVCRPLLEKKKPTL